MGRNTIKGHGFKVGDLVDYFGRDESATDQADRAILSKEGTVYVLTVVGGKFDGTRVAKFGAATKIWAAPVATEPVAPVVEEGQRYVSHWTGTELTVTRVDRKADGTVARVIVRNESDGFIGWHEDFVRQVTDGDLSLEAGEDKITDGALDFIMALVDQDMKLRGHAAPQDARTAVISAPVSFRLGRGKRKASKRQARRNRGVSK